MSVQTNKNNSNYTFEYEYYDIFEKKHTNNIDISNQKHQPSPFRVAAAVAARWKQKCYKEGVYETINIINFETFN